MTLDQLSEQITPFDRGTYWVKSRTPGTEDRLVDLEDNDGLGGCNCPDCEIRVAKEIKDGKPRRDCYHIGIVREYLKLQNEPNNS